MRISDQYFEWLTHLHKEYDLFDGTFGESAIGISLSPIKMEELRKPFSRFHASKHLSHKDSLYLAGVPSSWGGAYNSNFIGGEL